MVEKEDEEEEDEDFDDDDEANPSGHKLGKAGKKGVDPKECKQQ